MKEEYDFSKGTRSRFYRPGATLVPPIRLEDDVAAYLVERAQARGLTLSSLVNTLLKRDIELIEAAGEP